MLEPLYQHLHRYTELSKDDFTRLEPYFEIRHFEKGVILTDAGEIENYVNYIAKGLIRKFFYRKENEVITQIAKETDFICSSVSFLTHQPSHYVVEALESSTTISISWKNLEKVYKMGTGMERMGRIFITDWILQKETWENDRVSLSPQKRFNKFVMENMDLVKRVPQKYLASYLNIAPETFSRYKNNLETSV